MSRLAAEQITQQALALAEEERAELAEKLALSLAKPQLSPAWAQEVNSRLEGVRSGRVKTIPRDQVMAKALLIANSED